MRIKHDGTPHLGDLRRVLASLDDVIVRQKGGGWIICQRIGGDWIETPLHPAMGERGAIELALWASKSCCAQVTAPTV